MSAVFSGYTESNLRSGYFHFTSYKKFLQERQNENRALVYNTKKLELMSLLCSLTFNFYIHVLRCFLVEEIIVLFHYVEQVTLRLFSRSPLGCLTDNDFIVMNAVGPSWHRTYMCKLMCLFHSEHQKQSVPKSKAYDLVNWFIHPFILVNLSQLLP